MIAEHYKYISSKTKTLYAFESEGVQGKILKGIAFTPYKGKLWNLAFGDIKNGDIDDSIISNNYDIVKIMNTIAKVVYEFTDNFPTRSILIDPVDEKRKRLYNHIFRRNFEDISLNFHIIGTINNIDERYSPEKNYDKFKLKRKFVK